MPLKRREHEAVAPPAALPVRQRDSPGPRQQPAAHVRLHHQGPQLAVFSVLQEQPLPRSGRLVRPLLLEWRPEAVRLLGTPSPAPTFGNESASEDLEQEENSREEDMVEPNSSFPDIPGMRRSPGKSKSDLMEQMFRAALLRKAKQANGQKPLEEMSNHLPELPTCPMEADSKEFWVHEECAAWSKSIYLFGHRLRGLEETVLKAVDKLCSRCKFPGASLSCARDNCPELYHYLCARDNCCHMEEDSYTIYCPQHKMQLLQSEKRK
ncbi:retinoic acid-induced protein 1 [Caerostris extrusa]|uniref:Retinoic acid-induced protein 1 n=1 Tax=Caerostris extrusa TaxID=172846 RepID=A0AAV4MAF3_CAEEX|nr:retinoic acid-induced protein 1 [Caerostris extrusa]